jgi:hypothetical protein
MNSTSTSMVTSKPLAPRSLKQQVATFSDHARLERQTRELRRQQLRAEQRRDSNDPGTRVCAWEELHGLQLPSDPAHPVLLAIANGTRLSVLQVQDEQRARAAAGSGAKPGAQFLR